MGTTGTIKDLSEWYEKEERTMKFKDRFMVRGAGLLWLPAFFILWMLFILLIIDILCDELIIFNSPYQILILGIIFIIIGIVFSIVEINRILILNRYDKYAKNFFNNLMRAQELDYSNIEKSFKEFMDLLEQHNIWQKITAEDIKDSAFQKYRQLQDNILYFKKEYFVWKTTKDNET